MNKEEAATLLIKMVFVAGVVSGMLISYFIIRRQENRLMDRMGMLAKKCPCCTATIHSSDKRCPECYVELEGR